MNLSNRKIKIIIACIALLTIFISNVVVIGISVAMLLPFCIKELLTKKTIIFILLFSLMAFVPTVFIHSKEFFYITVLMILRSLVLFFSIMTIAENINLQNTHSRISKILGNNFATILTFAFNLLPSFKHSLFKTICLFYLKNKTRSSIWHKFSTLAIIIFKHALNTANCCAENMLLTSKAKSPKIVIITGPKHSGKTTYAKELANRFKAKNWPISGIIAPSLMKNNRRSTIFVEDITTNEIKLLASRTTPINDLLYEYGGFNFSKSGLDFAKSALKMHHNNGIVFLDEYGPLEFANLGFSENFSSLIKTNVSAIYVVVREEMLNRFLKEYEHLCCEVIRIIEKQAFAKIVVANKLA